MLLTFSLTVFAWIFFRAESMGHAWQIIGQVFSKTLFATPYFENGTRAIPVLIVLAIFLLIEWIGRESQYAIAGIDSLLPKPLKWVFYYSTIIVTIYFTGSGQQFIYFQF